MQRPSQCCPPLLLPTVPLPIGSLTMTWRLKWPQCPPLSLFTRPWWMENFSTSPRWARSVLARILLTLKLRCGIFKLQKDILTYRSTRCPPGLNKLFADPPRTGPRHLQSPSSRRGQRRNDPKTRFLLPRAPHLRLRSTTSLGRPLSTSPPPTRCSPLRLLLTHL